MTAREQAARAAFKEGYNCSQAVVLAFADLMGLEQEALLRIASSYGGGMGRLREVCGAVSGMFFVAGYLFGYSDPKDYEGKKAHYAGIQSLAAAFREENGSIVCRELLGEKGKDTSFVPDKRTEEYYKKRPCEEMVASAVRILECYIEEKRQSR